MARPPLELETWGRIRRTAIDGKPTAVCRYRDSDGVTRPMQRQGRTLAEAERNLIKALKKRLAPAGEDLTRESTVRQLGAKWLDEELPQRELATQSVRRYTDLVNRIIVGGIGDVRLGELTVPRIDRFLAKVRQQNGESTAATVRTLLLQTLSFAVRQGAIARNPAEAARTIRRAKKAEIALSVEDVWNIRDLLRARDEGTDKQGRRRYTRIADMYIGTGARTNEVLALSLTENVFFNAPTPFVRLDRTLIEGDDGKLGRAVEAEDGLVDPGCEAAAVHGRHADAPAGGVVQRDRVPVVDGDVSVGQQPHAAVEGRARGERVRVGHADEVPQGRRDAARRRGGHEGGSRSARELRGGRGEALHQAGPSAGSGCGTRGARDVLPPGVAKARSGSDCGPDRHLGDDLPFPGRT